MSSCKAAVIVTLREYDFGKGEAVLDMVDGREARIPLRDVISTVNDRPSGAPVAIDDTMVGHALLSTDDWTLVLTDRSIMPVVVPTKRVSFTTQG